MKGVLALGNSLKSDDGVGAYIFEKLRGKGLFAIFGGDAPENVLHRLEGRGIDRLWIVDAADFGGEPGEIRILDDLPQDVSLSTHATNLATLVRYIKKEYGVTSRFILIQAKSLDFGGELCKEVMAAADKVVTFLTTGTSP